MCSVDGLVVKLFYSGLLFCVNVNGVVLIDVRCKCYCVVFWWNVVSCMFDSVVCVLVSVMSGLIGLFVICILKCRCGLVVVFVILIELICCFCFIVLLVLSL